MICRIVSSSGLWSFDVESQWHAMIYYGYSCKLQVAKYDDNNVNPGLINPYSDY